MTAADSEQDRPPTATAEHSRRNSLEKVTPSLFDSPNLRELVKHQPLQTPGATVDHERIFYNDELPSQNGFPFPTSAEPRPIAPSDPHSPAWGRKSTFNQPRSKAASPPPTSIAKYIQMRRHSAKLEAKGNWNIKTSDQDHGSNHDKAFKNAQWNVEAADQGNGGLRNAMSAVLGSEDSKIDHILSIGSLGMPVDVLDESKKAEIAGKLESDYDACVVFTSDSDFDGHYSHFCKTILWPVFHYQIPDNPKSKAYEDHSWVYYEKVNQVFADKIVENYKRGDVVWIHDYHLLLVPAMVRKRLPDAQIGFFLHVAFPSSEVFRCLAVRRQLLQGMLGADLIGFQTEEYCRHFLQTCGRLQCGEATNDGIQLEDRFVNVQRFPIGIDPKSLNDRRRNPDVEQWIQVIREKYAGKYLIVGRDKLDPVRGVRQKLLAYELFLNKYPHWKDKVVLVQVATSTTEQAELDATVSDIVTRVNSMHSTLAHQPLVFLKQDIGYAQYLALITVADILLITSLREGMNLTSHEFIFCQEGQSDKERLGALILSEFTGTSSVLGGHQLSVNPWDYREISESIRTALEMTNDERRQRWSKCYQAVTHRTAAYWFTSFVETLDRVWREHSSRDSISIPRLSINAVGQKYQAADRRLFILGYEGTLASVNTPGTNVLSSLQRLHDILSDLADDPKNIIYLTSGRTPEELERQFARIPGLGFIAENGCFVREPGALEWIEMADSEAVSRWKDSVRSIIQYYQERTEGSWMEERHCSLLLHYRTSEDRQAAARQAAECANQIDDASHSQGLHCVSQDGVLMVAPTQWSRGSAAKMVFERLNTKYVKEKGGPIPDFLFVAGDARQDEAIFKWANQLEGEVVRDVTTVSVGRRNTEALFTLTQGITGKSCSYSVLIRVKSD